MKEQKTLLEKIRENRPMAMAGREIEEAEVMVEWVRGNLSTKEVRVALGIACSANVYSKAATVLRKLTTKGIISISAYWEGAPGGASLDPTLPVPPINESDTEILGCRSEVPII